MDNLIVALDGFEVHEALPTVEYLKDYVWGIKLNDGLDGYPSVFHALQRAHFGESDSRIMVDGKFLDIPKTMYNRVKKYGDTAKIVTIHALNSELAIEMAVKAAEEEGIEVFAVTWLTSWDIQTAFDLGMARKGDIGAGGSSMHIKGRVSWLAKRVLRLGVHGIIASVHEVDSIRQFCQEDDKPKVKVITPGIKPRWSVSEDQIRVATPAIAATKDPYKIVVGRAITEGDSPQEMELRIKAIQKEYETGIEQLKAPTV